MYVYKELNKIIFQCLIFTFALRSLQLAFISHGWTGLRYWRSINPPQYKQLVKPLPSLEGTKSTTISSYFNVFVKILWQVKRCYKEFEYSSLSRSWNWATQECVLSVKVVEKWPLAKFSINIVKPKSAYKVRPHWSSLSTKEESHGFLKQQRLNICPADIGIMCDAC